MTTTTARQHVHHDLIIEWAKNPTKKVQYKSKWSNEWLDCSSHQAPHWNVTLDYRFKPEMVPITYRKALMKNWAGTGYLITNIHATVFINKEIMRDARFIKWLGDPITETIEL